jgi:hypothetical protein
VFAGGAPVVVARLWRALLGRKAKVEKKYFMSARDKSAKRSQKIIWIFLFCFFFCRHEKLYFFFASNRAPTTLRTGIVSRRQQQALEEPPPSDVSYRI